LEYALAKSSGKGITSFPTPTGTLACIRILDVNPQDLENIWILSMEYHRRLGFVPVGTQQTEGGRKEAAQLEMKL
jgi:predicted GNAT superfamily acetyltransferase